MSLIRQQRRDDLFDFAVQEVNGFTVEDVMAELEITHHQANQAIHDLRLFLGDFDSLNLPCDPAGHCERWLYRLVGDLDSTRVWSTNRVRDAESRIRTMDAMLQSIVRATDGRSTQGRKARVMERALRRLVEDLDTILMDGP